MCVEILTVILQKVRILNIKLFFFLTTPRPMIFKICANCESIPYYNIVDARILMVDGPPSYVWNTYNKMFIFACFAHI